MTFTLLLSNVHEDNRTSAVPVTYSPALAWQTTDGSISSGFMNRL